MSKHLPPDMPVFPPAPCNGQDCAACPRSNGAASSAPALPCVFHEERYVSPCWRHTCLTAVPYVDGCIEPCNSLRMLAVRRM